MFNNCNLFGVFDENNEEVIKRIKVDRDTQVLINKHFNDIYSEFDLKTKSRIEFDGRYKPEIDEILEIKNFELNADIITAIVEPLAENSHDEKDIEINNLKYVFIGSVENEKALILFQKIQNSQHLSSDGIKLFQKKGTFESVGRSGFTLSSHIDGIYYNDDLLFTSYFFARQLFDLQKYYITATDDDIYQFCDSEKLFIHDKTVLFDNADTWVRRKIALINASEILEKNDIKYIKKMAIEFELELNSKTIDGKSKVVLPEDKKELKDLLKFLDEDLYKGIFTKKTYETNSKLVKK